jgi:hypothetical protein
MTKLTLPTDSEERKSIPVLSGCLNYAPAAIAWFARISVKGDRKHNPENAGNPPFHARGKSMDHGDCIIRHTMDIEDLKAAIRRDGSGGLHPSPVVVGQLLEEAAYRFWRAGIELQQLCEQYAGAPLAPAARLPETPGQGFADEVMTQYKALAASQLPAGGLVAGMLAPEPYEPPQLSPPKDQERVYVERMRERVRKTEESLKVGDRDVDSWGPSS